MPQTAAIETPNGTPVLFEIYQRFDELKIAVVDRQVLVRAVRARAGKDPGGL